ncbi:CLIP-associating protein 1-like [Cygnus atratus]|uniref:CLIP-associating protein 1-like n=1 Tax=Cygnus atratus TaxID=8868 RepID=UPI0015D6440E|nr:CLIP-associating protein 1-like [Cygnus atratus]
MDHFCQQVQQKDVGRRLQVGQELLEYLSDPAASPDVEQDPQRLDRVIDELAAWVNSSNFKSESLKKGRAIEINISCNVSHSLPWTNSFPSSHMSVHKGMLTDKAVHPTDRV